MKKLVEGMKYSR